LNATTISDDDSWFFRGLDVERIGLREASVKPLDCDLRQPAKAAGSKVDS
jgi:hypothetical protein